MARKSKVLLSCAVCAALIVSWRHVDLENSLPGAPKVRTTRTTDAEYLMLGRSGKASAIESKTNLAPEAQGVYGGKENGGSATTEADTAGSLTPLRHTASSLNAAADARRMDNRKSTAKKAGDSATGAARPVLAARMSKTAVPEMNVTVFNDKLFLISAYADRRKGSPSVKIIVFAHKSFDADLHCSIDGRRHKALLTWINFPSEELAVWRAGYLECHVTGLSAHPSAFELFDGVGGESVRMPLGETLQESKEPRRTFGLCVKSGYGAPSALRFIEWMELQSLLGVELVALYDQNLRGPVSKAMRHYEDSGRLVVVKDNSRRLIERAQPRFVDLFSTYEATRATGDEPYSQLELLSIQDCFHRFRGLFEYIVVADIDEAIVPADGGTLHDLLRALRRRAPAATSFSHQSAAYLPHFAASNSSGRTYMLAHTRRTEITWDGSKAFHSTADTESLNWHRRIDPGSNVAYVEPSEAWLHHYRGSCKGFSCDSNVKVIDDGMSVLGKFAAALSSRVAEVSDKLYDDGQAAVVYAGI